jgi:hypothetical protein
LDDRGRDEKGHEDACADQVSAIVSVLIGLQERHCHGITASLAKRRRQNLDDPETERDLRNLAQPCFYACHVRSIP